MNFALIYQKVPFQTFWRTHLHPTSETYRELWSRYHQPEIVRFIGSAGLCEQLVKSRSTDTLDLLFRLAHIGAEYISKL